MRGDVAQLTTSRANPLIFVERNRPMRAEYVPLQYLPERTRAAIYKRRMWLDWRELRRRELYEAALQAQPGAFYRYLHFSWTHMHPYWEWPDFYADQLERVRWAYKRIGKTPMEPRGKYFLVDRESELEMSRLRLQSRMVGISSTATTYSNSVVQGGGGVVAGAFHIWPGGPGASDSNDGILISEGGTGPRATWNGFRTLTESGTPGLGDWIYLHAGTYQPDDKTEPSGGGSSNSASKITVAGYPGDTAIIDFEANDDTLAPLNANINNSSQPINHASSNYRWRDLTVKCFYMAFCATPNRRGIEYINIVRPTPSGDGAGAVGGQQGFIGYDSNEFGLIEGCRAAATLHSSGANHAVMYWIYGSPITFRNNNVHGTNAGGVSVPPWHHKRGASANLGDTTFENNYTERDAGGDCYHFPNTDRTLFQHNITVMAGNSDFATWGVSAGQDATNGFACWQNTWDHNTFFCRGDPGAFQFHIFHQNEANPAGEDNTVTNNVIGGSYHIMRNETLRDLNTISDYNMVDSQDTANPFREGTTNYNLAGWQANDTNFASSTHDNNTKVENGINWVGTNPTSDDMASFALDAASAGHNAASDATDIGADVSLVGPEALGY